MSNEEKTPGRFPPPPPAPGASKPPRQAPTNRFAAVAEELEPEAIPPPVKPAPPASLEVAVRAPRLFDEPIRIVDGKPTPCPKCGCQVFELVTVSTNAFIAGVGPRVMCRCCPLPVPVYSLDLGGRNNSTPLKTTRVRCGACGLKTDVTTTVDHLNIYCRGCSRLALHDTFNGLAGIMIRER